MPSLFKISLFVALFGTFLLLFLSNVLEPKLTKIKDINKGMLDNFVKIQGNITKMWDKEKTKVLELQDKTGSIDVIVFEENILQLSRGMQIEIIGKVSEYKGKLQINAEKIEVLEQKG